MRITYEKTVPEFNNYRGKLKMTYYYSCADCNCEVKYYKILPDKVEPRCATCRANRKKAARIALRQAEDEELKRKAVKEFAEWLVDSKFHSICNQGFLYGESFAPYWDFPCVNVDEILAEYEKEARE